MSDRPLLSVCIITYNQVNFIRQAIASVLAQNVNCTWEIIVADDLSTDGTREIIIDFKRQFPDHIKLILQPKNVGPGKNWHMLVDAAAGKYISYLEGDDFWSDTNKLQIQVDFLEQHPCFVGCFHNTEERYEDEDLASFLYCKYPSAQPITFKDISYANLIPSCSMMYRNRLFEFPSWFYKLKMGDWPLHLLNAQHGDYWYIPKVMAVHRLHKKSIWMLQDVSRNNQYVVEAYDTMIASFESGSEFQQWLKVAKAAYTAPPPKPTVARRGINALRRLKNKLS